ncbi:unnamed protein product [Amoebophrya sp. A120]|nr:unnamed protein product [Amoebophrya sp. A120]|eukprot:GSA120T00013379001.1
MSRNYHTMALSSCRGTRTASLSGIIPHRAWTATPSSSASLVPALFVVRSGGKKYHGTSCRAANSCSQPPSCGPAVLVKNASTCSYHFYSTTAAAAGAPPSALHKNSVVDAVVAAPAGGNREDHAGVVCSSVRSFTSGAPSLVVARQTSSTGEDPGDQIVSRSSGGGGDLHVEDNKSRAVSPVISKIPEEFQIKPNPSDYRLPLSYFPENPPNVVTDKMIRETKLRRHAFQTAKLLFEAKQRKVFHYTLVFWRYCLVKALKFRYLAHWKRDVVVELAAYAPESTTTNHTTSAIPAPSTRQEVLESSLRRYHLRSLFGPFGSRVLARLEDKFGREIVPLKKFATGGATTTTTTTLVDGEINKEHQPTDNNINSQELRLRSGDFALMQEAVRDSETFSVAARQSIANQFHESLKADGVLNFCFKKLLQAMHRQAVTGSRRQKFDGYDSYADLLCAGYCEGGSTAEASGGSSSLSATPPSGASTPRSETLRAINEHWGSWFLRQMEALDTEETKTGTGINSKKTQQQPALDANSAADAATTASTTDHVKIRSSREGSTTIRPSWFELQTFTHDRLLPETKSQQNQEALLVVDADLEQLMSFIGTIAGVKLKLSRADFDSVTYKLLDPPRHLPYDQRPDYFNFHKAQANKARTICLHLGSSISASASSSPQRNKNPLSTTNPFTKRRDSGNLTKNASTSNGGQDGFSRTYTGGLFPANTTDTRAAAAMFSGGDTRACASVSHVPVETDVVRDPLPWAAVWNVNAPQIHHLRSDTHVRLLSLCDLQALLHELGHAFHFCLTAHKYEELRVMQETKLELPSTALEYLVQDRDFMQHVIENCQVPHAKDVMQDLKRKRKEFESTLSAADVDFRSWLTTQQIEHWDLQKNAYLFDTLFGKGGLPEMASGAKKQDDPENNIKFSSTEALCQFAREKYVESCAGRELSLSEGAATGACSSRTTSSENSIHFHPLGVPEILSLFTHENAPLLSLFTHQVLRWWRDDRKWYHHLVNRVVLLTTSPFVLLTYWLDWIAQRWFPAALFRSPFYCVFPNTVSHILAKVEGLRLARQEDYLFLFYRDYWVNGMMNDASASTSTAAAIPSTSSSEQMTAAGTGAPAGEQESRPSTSLQQYFDAMRISGNIKTGAGGEADDETGSAGELKLIRPPEQLPDYKDY